MLSEYRRDSTDREQVEKKCAEEGFEPVWLEGGGLRLLSKANLDQPNLVMAGTVIAAVPIFAVLFFFQRQLVRGLTAGAVKG